MNSLGVFSFLLWLDPPQLPRTELDLNRRSGVDGIGVRDTGRRGRPFTMTSVAAYPTLTVANYAWGQYLKLIGSDPEPLVWNGFNSTSRGLLYLAIDGGPVQGTPRVVAHIQGVPSSYKTLLFFRWVLVPIEVTVQ